MLRFQNKKVALHLGRVPRYEIFWVSQFAEHVVKREAHHSHLISITEVETLANHPKTRYVPFGDAARGEQFVLGLGRFQKKLYQILCYFVDKPQRRCVIKTCHVVHEPKLLMLCQKLEI